MQVRSDDAILDAMDQGSGTPIVLLHGFPLKKETWDMQATLLAESARVIRLDLRGLGRSSVPDGPYLMQTLAADVAAVLDACNLERAVIVGHSLGSYVALAFFRLFAERVLGLGIVCGNASADDREQKLRRYELAGRVEREGASVLVEPYVDRYFAPRFYTERPEMISRITEIVQAASPGGAAGILRGMAERDAADDLFGDIHVPVAIIAGAQDAFASVESGEQLASQLGTAKLSVFDCGHMPLWEAPDETARAIAELAVRAR